MLSAERIGITPQELEALIGVRNKLRSGQYCYAPKNWEQIKDWYEDKEDRRYMDDPGFPRGDRLHIFNMGVVFDKFDCNSIGCIAGWMLKEPSMANFDLEGRSKDWWATHHETLEPLFYPQGVGSSSWADITPEAAADAIDNVFNTGKPDWKAVAEKHDLSYYEEED